MSSVEDAHALKTPYPEIVDSPLMLNIGNVEASGE
jgi:hypothetical protein